VCASDCVRLFDSYGLLNGESTQPTGESATGIPCASTIVGRVSVDIVERLRNATGTTHSGNSGPDRTGEFVRTPVNPPAPERVVTLEHGSPSGTGSDDGSRDAFLQ
jgi:hypothetical protein